jgi:hypothetical protein
LNRRVGVRARDRVMVPIKASIILPFI